MANIVAPSGNWLCFSGEFLLPRSESIAAAALEPRTPLDGASLWSTPRALVNCEYAVVFTKQPNPETTAAI
jgi:hypothetical protein